MTNYLTSNKIYLILVLLLFSKIAFPSVTDVDRAVNVFNQDYPDVKISIISYGKSKKHCNYPLEINSKQPIKPSSRWILKVACPGSWKANISTKTKVLHRQYIAKTNIYSKEKITPSMVNFRELWTEKATTNYIDVIGKVAKTKISKGTIIKPYNLTKNYTVSKKQKIAVIVSSKAMKLKISAITLEPGDIYDIIEVMNIRSRKKLLVKIISKNEAILE